MLEILDAIQQTNLGLAVGSWTLSNEVLAKAKANGTHLVILRGTASQGSATEETYVSLHKNGQLVKNTETLVVRSGAAGIYGTFNIVKLIYLEQNETVQLAGYLSGGSGNVWVQSILECRAVLEMVNLG